MTVCDPALGQIVRGHLQSDAVAGQHSNAIAPQLPRQVGQHRTFLIQLDTK